jgi:septum site-determining protein MinD
MAAIRSTTGLLSRALRTPNRPAALACWRQQSTAPADIPPQHDLAEGGTVVCVTSGKGGVGKTTTSASLAMGLAERGFRVCAVDFDIGLRNLDLHLGCERRIVFDFVNIIQEECKLHQALIKDRHQPNLFMLAASQTRDKTALTTQGVEDVISQLRSSFDYIVCDSPAGIENGATQAMRHADIALVCTNPELSSVRDSDKMLSIVASKSKRAELNMDPVQSYLLITRYEAERVARDNMLGAADIQEMLGVPLLGVVPESDDVLKSTNIGRPAILMGESDVAFAYQDLVRRFLGEDCELRFLAPKSKGIMGSIFGK